MEKFDVIIVGGGPAGLSTAYHLAKRGFDILLLERGSEIGSKNVFGGRIYSKPFDRYFEGFRKEAPIERWVKEERLTFISKDNSTDISFFHDEKMERESFTTFLSNLLKWMGSLVENYGGLIVTNTRVDSLIIKSNGNGIVGVATNDEKIFADYVIIAEGSNGYLLEKHGLWHRPKPQNVAIGVKEVIKVGKKRIDTWLGGDWGLAWLFVGDITGSFPGGAFLYTMKEYITIGVVVRLASVHDLNIDIKDIVEKFRLYDRIRNITKDGTLIEYQAKLVREKGYHDLMTKPYGDGYLVVGEAAGIILNTGFTIHGVDLAVENGKIAADIIEYAHKIGKNDAETLSKYKKSLWSSIVNQKMRKLRRLERLLDDEDVYNIFPNLICKLIRNIYNTSEIVSPKEAISDALKGYSLIKLLIKLVGVVI